MVLERLWSRMFKDMSVTDLIALQAEGKVTVVDVRSPGEYADATIPGSVNIPLFDDAERAEIGTIYKQKSVALANERGIEIVSAKLPAFIRTFAAIPGPKVVFCWRGGMRSKTAATLLDLVGMRMSRLTGGYRAYRKWVVAELAVRTVPERTIVLHGYTGTGKTEILRSLQGKGYPVVDFEQFAGHRGSIFGGIGRKPHNQKMFDALLLQRWMEVADAPYVLMEAESRRIGKVLIPEVWMDAKVRAHHIWLELPMAERVATILRDYEPERHAEACVLAFRRIKGRIHTAVAADIERALASGAYALAAELLLVHYYDARYAYTTESYEAGIHTRVEADSIADAIGQIEQLLLREA